MKKAVVLLLAAVLTIGLLGGCSKSSDENKSTENNNTLEENKTTNENTGEDNSENNSGENNSDKEDAANGNENETANNSTEFSFPLEEKEELSIWCAWSNNYLEDPNEMIAQQRLEELTNVHINYTHVTLQEATEKYGLLLASGDYPDITMQNNYPGGMEKGVEDGVYIDLTDYVNNCMPNYKAMMDSNEGVARDCITDNQRYIQIYSINGNDEGINLERAYLGLAIRKDWLDELGLEIPVTIEDWHTVLTAFKEQKGATAPLMLGKDGFMSTNAFLTAYGVLQEYFIKDGKVQFGPVTEGYRQYVELMRQWYSEGLVDPDFTANNSSDTMPLDYVANDKTGAGQFLSGWMGDYMRTGFGMTQNEEFFLTGVQPPVQNEGDTSYTNFTSATTGVAAAITSNCKNPELACRWLDFLYTKEGIDAKNYGREGETYTVDANGNYQWTDFVMNNPDGYTKSDAANLVTSSFTLVGFYNWEAIEKFDGSHDGDVSLIKDAWSIADTSMIYPEPASMTESEGTEYSSIYTNIETLVDEMTIKFITGAESLDGYDNFVEQLNTYGLQTCLDIKQAAYDRYINRTK